MTSAPAPIQPSCPFRLRPITIKRALEFNAVTHRRLPKLQGAMWAIALEGANKLLMGVIIVGRPTARLLDNGWRLQVLRCAVQENIPNSCSMLYGAVARAAKAMGASDCLTYIHSDESGLSLKASGWLEDTNFQSSAGEWSRPSRLRSPTVEIGPKRRFYAAWSEALKSGELSK